MDRAKKPRRARGFFVLAAFTHPLVEKPTTHLNMMQLKKGSFRLFIGFIMIAVSRVNLHTAKSCLY